MFGQEVGNLNAGRRSENTMYTTYGTLTAVAAHN